MRKGSVPLVGLAGVQNYCINYAIIMHTHRHENWERRHKYFIQYEL